MSTIDNSIQLSSSGKLRHLLGLKNLSQTQLQYILTVASGLIENGVLKKSHTLKDITVANLFFEPSTRTRNTFEIAAKNSGANVINVDLENSATKKNEGLFDTMQTLAAMPIDIFIVRHQTNGLVHRIATKMHNVGVINAGDGTNAHPTQALLDMLTIYQHRPDMSKLSVAIVGDIIHSRVAHSDICALTILGVQDIRLIAPPRLQQHSYESDCVICTSDLKKGIQDADVIIILRLQKERMLAFDMPNEIEYFANYGLTQEKLNLAKSNAIVMHPGPINREVEIASAVADGKQSVILKQVTNGIAVRMAVMSILIKNIKTDTL